MIRRDFEKLVRAGIRSLPEKIQKKLDNVVVVIENFPPKDFGQFRVRRNLQFFGLYQGVPKTKRGVHYSGVLPDKITIFQKPIEKLAGGKREIENLVRIVVWHEIAHHFGFSEKKVRELERKWKRSL